VVLFSGHLEYLTTIGYILHKCIGYFLHKGIGYILHEGIGYILRALGTF
jgi:hypothetical protein